MEIMKKIFFTLSLIIVFSINAQIQQGGTPYAFNKSDLPNNSVINLASFDLNALKLEDEILDLHKDIPYRFGHNFDVNYTTENSGEWINLNNGDRLWRITFFSQDALTLNFLLKNYDLAEGCSLFFYNEDFTSVLGSFTNKNNQVHKNLATHLIIGNKITLEFYEPSEAKNLSTFTISRITHGYRSLKLPTKGPGDSGNCNNNVICSVGDNWRDEIRSVGIIIVGGSTQCTGALINNTCLDKKPYFLTANHCTSGEDVTTWSIGFNFESTSCNSNTGYNSPSFQSVNVLALRANNGGSDFSLLELVNQPPTSYNVFFAGWDKSGTNPTSQVAIHHPSGDLKKISFDNDPATPSTAFGGAQTWHISNWEDGTTEPGSSGSPLFDQNHRIIGQLYGGSAWCGNNVDDFYGRFDVSWNGGSNNANQLVSWLDDCNTNENFIDGINHDYVGIIENDVAISFLNPPNTINCGTNIPQQITITNNGTNAVTAINFTYGLTGNIQTYNWTGNLAQNEFETVSLANLFLCKGESYNYNLEIISSNLTTDQFPANDSESFTFSVENGNLLRVEVQTNYAASETSFELSNFAGDIIQSESSFTNNQLVVYQYCLTKDDYVFKMLDSGNNGLTATIASDSGYYKLYLDNVLLISNDDFSSEETTTFSTEGNGLFADFNNSQQMATVPFDLTSTSFGSASTYEWTAPSATTSSNSMNSFNTSYNNAGNYDITLKITNSTACDRRTKQIEVVQYNSVNDVDNYFMQSIYPNPTNNNITIDTDNYKNTTIKITNNLGKIIVIKEMNNSKEIIDLSNYSKGVYYLTLKNGDNISNFKVLKD